MAQFRVAMRGLTRRATVVMAGTAVLAAGMAIAAAGPAAATPAVLYASVTATGTGDCSAAADACTLSTALTLVGAGGVINLITPGAHTAASRYVGNWSVTTSGTSASAPVTIEAAAGLAERPVLDGDGSHAPVGETCSTAPSAPCNGPVLTVPAGEFVALSGITIADANDITAEGGALDNAGTVTITGCDFTRNHSIRGGAIDTADGYGLGPTGSVTVTASTFSGNTARDYGGAINSGINGGGSVTVTASTFSGNTAGYYGGAIASGLIFGNGSVRVTASTFSGNTADEFGGAIASGIFSGGGLMTVTDSTFSGNSARLYGGAINSGDLQGAGTVTVADSTFSGNTAGFGGAISGGDNEGGGLVTVTASTFAANTVPGGVGGTIDSGLSGGGTVAVAGDVFDGGCDRMGGSWFDGGYNAGSDGSCFSLGIGDVNAGSAAALNLGPLVGNGGLTKTIAPRTTSEAIRIIPDPTTLIVGSTQAMLCPATDQRGYSSAAQTSCDAGAVQTSGRPRALRLTDTAAPGSFNRAGQVITYSYTVSNIGAGTLTGITVTDPAVPAVSCPAASLAPGAHERCTGSDAVTQANLAAGTITDTATASAATASGVPVDSNTATVTVAEGWPPAVSGIFRPRPHAAMGYYLGVEGNTWSLIVTHPRGRKVVFTGTITLNAGTFRHLTQVDHESGDSVHVNHTTLKFRFTNYGDLDGVSFTTIPAATTITFTLTINGHPATATQIHLGRPPHHARHRSPLTFRR